MSSDSSCLCCPCFMFKCEAAERNFGGELNLAKRAAGNPSFGKKRGKLGCRQMGNRGEAGNTCKQK